MQRATGFLLTQVWFVRDNLRLVFEPFYFDLFGNLSIEFSGVTLKSGDAGYCDALVGSIGRKLERVEHGDKQISFVLNDGACMRLPLNSCPAGDEILVFGDTGSGFIDCVYSID